MYSVQFVEKEGVKSRISKVHVQLYMAGRGQGIVIHLHCYNSHLLPIPIKLEPSQKWWELIINSLKMESSEPLFSTLDLQMKLVKLL